MPENDTMTTTYCTYCWREADKTTTEESGAKVNYCAYHYLKIAAAESSYDAFAEQMGYDTAHQIFEQFEEEREPEIKISEAIGLVNHMTDPRGSPRNAKEPVVYTKVLREALADKARDSIETPTDDGDTE